MRLNALDLEMVHRALSLLHEGPHQLVIAPVVVHRACLETAWDLDQWSSLLNDSTETSFLGILSDASDHCSFTWVSSLDVNASLQADEYAITSGQDLFSRLSLMTEEEIATGSTVRELKEFIKFYSDEECMNRLIHLCESKRANGYTGGLIHLTDSKSTCTILRQGSSNHPHLLRLVLRWFDLTRRLRHEFGLIVGWVPREQNVAADAGSKMFHDWVVRPEIFTPLFEEFKFTLDAFASVSERALHLLPGIPQPRFCSRFVCEAALGDVRVVSFDNEIVWAYPPVTSKMIALTLQKFYRCHHCRIMVLCVPAQHNASWWPMVWNSRFHAFRTLDVGAALRVTGLDNHDALAYRSLTAKLNLFLYDKMKL